MSSPRSLFAAARNALRAATAPRMPWLGGAGLLCHLGAVLAAPAPQAKPTAQAAPAAQAKPAAQAAQAKPAAASPASVTPPWTMSAMRGPLSLDSSTPEALRLAACRAQLQAVLAARAPGPGDESPLTLDAIKGLEAKENERLHGASAGILCEQDEIPLRGAPALRRALVLRSGYQSNHFHLSSVGLLVQTREGFFHATLDTGESWKWYGVGVTAEKALAVGPLVQVQVESGQWSDGNPSSTDTYLYVAGVGPSGRPSLTRGIHISTSKSARHGDAERTASKTCPVALTPQGALIIGKPVIVRNKMGAGEFSGNDLTTPPGTIPLSPL